MSLIMKYAVLTTIEMVYVTLLFVGYLYKPELLGWEERQLIRVKKATRKALRRSKRVVKWATAESLPPIENVDKHVVKISPNARLALDDYLSADELDAWEKRFEAGETRQ